MENDVRVWAIFIGLFINLFATLLVVGKTRIALEHRITRLESSVDNIRDKINENSR